LTAPPPHPPDLQPGNGYQLPAEAYYSEQWHQREQTRLFRRTWNFVGDSRELANSGDYLTADIGGEPLLIVKGDDGQLRGFHNVCRHRGAKLLDSTGHCATITCPYHRWQYNLGGELINIPQQLDQLPGVDTKDWSLLPMRLQQWRGLLFVNPDGKAPEFNDWLGELSSLLAGFRPNELEALCESQFEFSANWKFYIENHVDWYHLWYTHPKSLRMWDHHDATIHQTGAHWVSFEPTHVGAAPMAPPLAAIPGLSETQRQNGAHLIFPNLTLFTGESYFALGYVQPITSERARMHFRAFIEPDQPTSPELAERFLAAFRQITEVEDAGMTARLQATVRSAAFSVGPMTLGYEAPIARFHDEYLSVMHA